MKKTIGEITFKEFSKFCNARACDGKWGLETAIICCDAMREVYKEKPLFRKNKAQEQKWQKIKGEFFNLDAEIDI